MISSHWQLVLVVGLIAAQTLIVYRAYRLRETGTAAGTGTAGAVADLVDTEDEVVECPDCGTDNELGYRYCRSCVAELPATMNFERNADGSLGRLTR